LHPITQQLSLTPFEGLANPSVLCNMAILETALPILNLAKASVSGIGIPGVEGAINAVVELATMVSVSESAFHDNSFLIQSRRCSRTKMIYPS
jgi:hypothetical protein